ncbi:hypothetical protein KFE98_19140 [bacterium SCSIO 12741]|nr:hypothetical protein KFE98_19140 [bacterium SCSIO 12741]
MWDKLNIKQRFAVLLGGMVGVLWLVWSFSLSNTLDRYQRYQSQQEQIRQYQEMKVQLMTQKNQVEQHLAALNQPEGEAISDFQERILFRLTQELENRKARIAEFPQLHEEENKQLHVKTQHFVLEGNYFDLLEVLNQLENGPYVGSIASVHFYKKKNKRLKRVQLFMKVYVQEIA